MLDVSVQIPTANDIEQLERWRQDFAAADLELPEGYANDGVATAVARNKKGDLIGSLTAEIILAASLDPFIRNPLAGRHESLSGLFALTRALEYQAQLAGAAASFIAVPNLLPDYQALVKRCGYDETAQSCKLFRRSFRRPSPATR